MSDNNQKKVLIINIDTNEEIVAESILKAGIIMNVSKQVVGYRLRKSNNNIINNKYKIEWHKKS